MEFSNFPQKLNTHTHTHNISSNLAGIIYLVGHQNLNHRASQSLNITKKFQSFAIVSDLYLYIALVHFIVMHFYAKELIFTWITL